MQRVRSLRLWAAALIAFVILAVVPAAPTDAATLGADQVVLVEPNGLWHIRRPGQPDYTFWYGNPGIDVGGVILFADQFLLGDWDGDGLDTPGVFRPGEPAIYLTNEFPADGSVAVGDPGAITFFAAIVSPEQATLVGDWDGDGIETLGAGYGPSGSSGRISLWNAIHTPGSEEIRYTFGGPTLVAHSGDPDGDGIDSVFLHEPSSGRVLYTTTNPAELDASAIVDGDMYFGIPGDRFVVGDWDGDGIDTMGVFRPSDTTVYLRNTLDTGIADEFYQFGEAEWIPVAGHFELEAVA